MPLFDFICRACGREFEFLVMGSERPFCPSCGSDDLLKQDVIFFFTYGREGWLRPGIIGM
ncbi:MAG: zinc ribbon domain-containing protein [Thermodesulfobacteriota bacterium]